MSLLSHYGIGVTTSQFLIVSILFLQNNIRHESIDTELKELRDYYDYIVVGSGSAGAIVAHRLAEDGHKQVLLLEAGGPSGVVIDIPGNAAQSQLFNTQYDWNYTNAEQPFGRAFLNHVMPENRGFVIGGTSSINTMVYNRGNSRDFDAWAKDYGAVGWSYSDVLPFFKKNEGNRDLKLVNENPTYHGTNGLIGITSWPSPDPLMVLHQKILNKEGGLPNVDFNGPTQTGTGFVQATIEKNGVRSSSSNAYIDPNPFPNNLHILTGALVTQIVFENKTAVGVLFERKHRKYIVSAHKEVILSGGVYGTAQLLMLSGIGPAEKLKELHIPVIQDLPVGHNLQNHPGILLNFLIKPESVKLLNEPGQLNLAHLQQWFTKGIGPLSSNYHTFAYSSSSSNKEKEWPNLSWQTTVHMFPSELSGIRQFQYQNQHEWNRYLENYLGRFYLYVYPRLMRTRSRGFVRLASTDPHIQPIIQPNFLKHPQDYNDTVEMIKIVLKFYELSSISEHLEPLSPIPGCSLCPDKCYLHECEPYIHCFIKEVLFSAYHPVGTCRMGDPHREDVVVDPHLRVKGISRLRVCDNSIVPLLMNANTNAAALMIGEKCAHIIKQ